MSSELLDRGLLAYTVLLLLAAVVIQCVEPLTDAHSSVVQVAALLPWLGWVIAHSTVVRGGQSTGQLLVMAGIIAFVVEALALNLTDAFHHNLAPQIVGVPVQIICAWIVYLYAGFAVTLALASPGRTWRGALLFCVGAALVTTALDLTADPVGVQLGSFEYRQGGAFMPEIEGANGAHGIPLLNYVGWVLLASSTYMAFWLRARGPEDESSCRPVSALLFYVGLFVAAAIPAVRLGRSELLLIGGLPVGLIVMLVVHRLNSDRQARVLGLRRGKERTRVTSLVERRLAAHRR